MVVSCRYCIAWGKQQVLMRIHIYMLQQCKKVFSLNWDMGNPIPSLFLGNFQWNLVKQYKNSDLYIIFHIATVTVNLF